MKGVIVERALTSNVLDIYALFKEGVKENLFDYQNPTPEQAKNYYFQLLRELSSPVNLFYIARRGRQYLGYIHGVLALRPYEQTNHLCFVNPLFVTAKKRKLGIGKKLTDRLKEDCRKMGVSRIELLCHDKMIDYWVKNKAQKVMNLMILEA